jgi:hypothetical protein
MFGRNFNSMDASDYAKMDKGIASDTLQERQISRITDPSFNKAMISVNPCAAVVDVIKKVFEVSGNFEEDKARGEAYGKSMGATPDNVRMMGVAASQGWDEAAKQMMKECNNDYSAMRARFG